MTRIKKSYYNDEKYTFDNSLVLKDFSTGTLQK